MKKILNSSLISLVSLLALCANVFADGPAVPAGAAPMAAGPTPNPMLQFVPIILIFGVFYFLMIRPQQKKLKEQQQMLSELKYGDEVVTASGILGKIAGMADKVITLEVENGVKMKMLKSQVVQVVKGSIKDIAQA